MKAADMTTRALPTRPPSTEAAQLMLQHRISALLVVDGSGKLVGVVSEGDLMRRAELGILNDSGLGDWNCSPVTVDWLPSMSNPCAQDTGRKTGTNLRQGQNDNGIPSRGH